MVLEQTRVAQLAVDEHQESEAVSASDETDDAQEHAGTWSRQMESWAHDQTVQHQEHALEVGVAWQPHPSMGQCQHEHEAAPGRCDRPAPLETVLEGQVRQERPHWMQAAPATQAGSARPVEESVKTGVALPPCRTELPREEAGKVEQELQG